MYFIQNSNDNNFSLKNYMTTLWIIELILFVLYKRGMTENNTHEKYFILMGFHLFSLFLHFMIRMFLCLSSNILSNIKFHKCL